MITRHWIKIEIILYYIILTNYYIVKDTFGWQVITAPPMWKWKQESKQNENNALNKIRKFIAFIAKHLHSIIL